MSEIKIIAFAVGIVVLLIGGIVVRKHIDQGGYDRCQGEHEQAKNNAKEKARENVVKVEKVYEPKIKQLQDAPDSNACVGPLTSHALDGL